MEHKGSKVVTYPWHYYLILSLATLALLISKDQVVISFYKDKRPSKATSSPSYYLGYVATHMVTSVLVFWTLEVIWRVNYDRDLINYGLLVGTTESMIRWGVFLFVTPGALQQAIPSTARMVNNFNYLIVALVAPAVVYLMEKFGG